MCGWEGEGIDGWWERSHTLWGLSPCGDGGCQQSIWGLVISVPMLLDLRFPVPFELPRGTGLYWSRQFRRWGSMESWKKYLKHGRYRFPLSFILSVILGKIHNLIRFCFFSLQVKCICPWERDNNVTTQKTWVVADSRYFLWNIHSKVFRETRVSKLPDTTPFLCTVGILKPNRE